MDVTENGTQEKILQVIYAAIDGLNDSMPKGRKIAKTPHAGLFDESGAVDSLGLTILIVALEKKIEEELGATVTLVNDAVMVKENNPFQNVSTLQQHISRLLAAAS